MRAAKYSTALAISALVTIGLLFSEVCALNCALYACSAAAKTPPPEQPSSHCRHQGKKEKRAPTPERHNESRNCLAHTDAIAVLPQSVNSLGTPHQHAPLHAAFPVIAQVSFESQRGRLPGNSSFRAPPARAVISALRI